MRSVTRYSLRKRLTIDRRVSFVKKKTINSHELGERKSSINVEKIRDESISYNRRKCIFGSKTYVCHLLVMEAVRLRRILRDRPHRQMVRCQQPLRGFQRQTDVLPEGLQVYLRLLRTPFVHRMQHRHNLVHRYWNLNAVCLRWFSRPRFTTLIKTNVQRSTISRYLNVSREKVQMLRTRWRLLAMITRVNFDRDATSFVRYDRPDR